MPHDVVAGLASFEDEASLEEVVGWAAIYPDFDFLRARLLESVSPCHVVLQKVSS